MDKATVKKGILAVLWAAGYASAADNLGIMTTLNSVNLSGIVQWAFAVIKVIIVEFVGLLPYLILIVVVGLVLYLIRQFMDMLPDWLGGFMNLGHKGRKK